MAVCNALSVPLVSFVASLAVAAEPLVQLLHSDAVFAVAAVAGEETRPWVACLIAAAKAQAELALY